MFLTQVQLENLPTPRLLSYKKKLYTRLWMPEDWVHDCTCEDCVRERNALYKLQNKIDLINKILSHREHVPRKGRSNGN